jgi:anti-sigma factor RsiW
MEPTRFPEDEQLLNYLDGSLTEAQARVLEQRVNQSPALQGRLEELRRIHTVLRAGTRMEMPSSTFTIRVMKNLDAFPVPGMSARNGVFLLIGILAAIGATVLLVQSGVFDSVNGAISFDALSLQKPWVKNALPPIAYNGKKIINVLLIIAMGLTFVLIDRTILRPWFDQRRMQGS